MARLPHGDCRPRDAARLFDRAGLAEVARLVPCPVGPCRPLPTAVPSLDCRWAAVALLAAVWRGCRTGQGIGARPADPAPSPFADRAGPFPSDPRLFGFGLFDSDRRESARPAARPLAADRAAADQVGAGPAVAGRIAVDQTA